MSFLVLVPTKRVPDTDGVIRVTPDELDVDTKISDHRARIKTEGAD